VHLKLSSARKKSTSVVGLWGHARGSLLARADSSGLSWRRIVGSVADGPVAATGRVRTCSIWASRSAGVTAAAGWSRSERGGVRGLTRSSARYPRSVLLVAPEWLRK